MELQDVFFLYHTEPPVQWTATDSSHGDQDFRQAVFAEWPDRKIVIKITSNDFTTIHRVECWRDTIEEYISAGCRCPRILVNRYGRYAEEIAYAGKTCVIYAEELAEFSTAESREEAEKGPAGKRPWREPALESIGIIGSKRLICADFPSGCCILERFVPSDPCDEVMETALRCRDVIGRELPEYRERFEKIWDLYMENRERLAAVYGALPSSVFQADLNSSNILVDGENSFAGLIDFNLCGRDTVINYLFREALMNFDEDVPGDEVFYSEEADKRAVASLLENIAIVRRTYAFSDVEIEYAPFVYRYVRPFWWNTVRQIEANCEDESRIGQILEWLEKQLTRADIEFARVME